MFEACLEKAEARTETSQEPWEAEIKTDQEEVETIESEVDQEKVEAVTEQQEVHNEVSAVVIIGATEDLITDRAVPARRKGRRKGSECNNEVKYGGGGRRQLRLRKEKISGRIFGKTVQLEVEK